MATSPEPLLDLSRFERIALFRPREFAHMLCAVPAMRAIRHAAPQSEITLIGLPWAAELAERLPEVDRFIEFPGLPGLNELIPDIAALPSFLEHMQGERFDLMVQMHDAGEIVNPWMPAFGARRCAGFVEPGRWCAEPELHATWPTAGHEIERLLGLVDHLGIPRQGTALEFPMSDTDRVELASLWPQAYGTQRIAVIHAGAQVPARRWPLEGFAKVADSLTEQGCQVVLTGTASERVLVDELQSLMKTESVNLAGLTNLWTLGAVIERASVVVCNDSGVSQIASSVDAPSVVLSVRDDPLRWAPLDRSRHKVIWKPTLEAIDPAEVDAAVHGLLEAQILVELERQMQPETSTITGDLLV